MYLGTYGVETCATWAAVAGSWPNLPQQWLLRGAAASYICSRNRELTRNVLIFLKYCHVYFLHSVNHISLFLKLVELRGGGMKLHSRNGEPRIDEKCFCEK